MIKEREVEAKLPPLAKNCRCLPDLLPALALCAKQRKTAGCQEITTEKMRGYRRCILVHIRVWMNRQDSRWLMHDHLTAGKVNSCGTQHQSSHPRKQEEIGQQ
jgi:hypothetical protein